MGEQTSLCKFGDSTEESPDPLPSPINICKSDDFTDYSLDSMMVPRFFGDTAPLTMSEPTFSDVVTATHTEIMSFPAWALEPDTVVPETPQDLVAVDGESELDLAVDGFVQDEEGRPFDTVVPETEGDLAVDGFVLDEEGRPFDTVVPETEGDLAVDGFVLDEEGRPLDMVVPETEGDLEPETVVPEPFDNWRG
ncbi:uncharacterized protein LOC130986367 [Salvia miltiorrhiza]|uniref:uncharacterized protein LOC130986367 n=1 Tax=Salvia miltiorrhiza TaxID=226208 RepID=UPI0025AD23D3|nr:uncharacterized protein LOC130986367 [Salvia miltiorrhiza]